MQLTSGDLHKKNVNWMQENAAIITPEFFYRGSQEIQIPDIAWRSCERSERVEFRE